MIWMITMTGAVSTITMNELISALTDPEKLYDPQKMAAFRQKFMSACDGHSTERIEQYAFGRSLR